MSEKLTIEFGSKEAMEHFAIWLCRQGEQDYWNWMKYRESEETELMSSSMVIITHSI